MLLKWLFILCCSTLFSQTSIEAVYKNAIPLKATDFFGVDNFNAAYFSTGPKIIKSRTDGTSINYSNVQLGNLTSVDVFNPLKINAFYDQFNTVIILDNRLAEVFKIDFNKKQPYKNVSFVSTGYDNTVWLFNQDLQQLELYDYKTNLTRVHTVPIDSNVLDLDSDYNNCWLLTDAYLYQYNYFGSLVSKIKNDGFEAISIYDEHVILKKGSTLYFITKDSKEIVPIDLPELLIKRFLVTNETLYIYDLEKLHTFQLKID